MMLIYFFAAVALLLIFTAKKVHPELVAFSKEGILKFLKFLGFLSLVRFVIFALFPEILPDPSTFAEIDFFSLLLVFWEDMFFVFPSMLTYKLTKKKRYLIPVMTLSSLVFASGHLYQGLYTAFLTLAYVPVMYHIGMRRGLMTVMVGHVIYDIVTLYSIKIAEWAHGIF